eukprot:TRINITY_DN946_c1_g1_i2.p1 TRINITY_DN946_c1_g1~~TRINITY_DN946_c1_g1_i2.p1  ORF type:complete len:321 (-),score=104.64 TRINITY_DN946_c1_g1_i2:120-1082(-)
MKSWIDDNEEAFAGGLLCCCCCIVIPSVIMFAVSFDTLTPTQVGIDFNGNTKTIDTNMVYKNGRYFLGLGHYFIKFPTTLKTLEFSSAKDANAGALAAFSNDGQNINLEVSFQYRVMTSGKQVIDIYKAMETNYEQQYVKEAQSSLKNVATRFTTVEFFSKRVEITQAMLSEVNSKLNPKWSTVELLQLRNVDIPDDFEDKIIDKVVANQDRRTKDEEQLVTQVRAATKVIESEADARITGIIAEANSKGFTRNQQAIADGFRAVLDAEGNSFKQLASTLNFTTDHLLTYLWSQQIKTAKEQTKLIVGFDGKGTILNLNN